MKIGVDARLLAEPVTGIGRYTSELTAELTNQSDHFFLYSANPIVVGNWQRPNVTTRASRFRQRIGRTLWFQSYLPWWAAKDRVDLFWGPSHRIPRYLPASVARVVTVHDLVWKHAGETMRPLSCRVERRLMPEAVRLADRIIVDSESTAKDLRAEYPEAMERIRVIYPGVSTLPQPEGHEVLVNMGIVRPYFLFVGTLEPRKNLKRLLQAYARLDATIRRHHLMVIAGGKGWGGVHIQRLIKDTALDGQVLVTGYVSDAELSTLYAHAQFLAMPSLYEGFGLPLLEAMSFGTPVLTSNLSSMPEVAGDAGVLVNPLDEGAIAAGLSSLLGDVKRRSELAVKAVPSAKRFSWKAAADQLRIVFDEAIEVRAAMLKSKHGE